MRRGRQPPALVQQVSHRAAGHVLHRQVQVFAVATLVEYGHDIGVGQARHRLGLTDETVNELVVGGQFPVHDLQRHRPVQPGVGGDVHRGHPAAGDAGLHTVTMVEQLPDQPVGDGGVHLR